jgi:hypothetical protein
VVGGVASAAGAAAWPLPDGAEADPWALPLPPEAWPLPADTPPPAESWFSSEKAMVPNPIATVPPERRVAGPAVATVLVTASRTLAPERRCSRKRLTTSRE